MLRFLSDENLKGAIVRGLRHRKPDLDLVRVQDVGLDGKDDPAILEWAANENRILLTHDRATIPDHAADRIERNQLMSGVFILSGHLAVNNAIEEILMLDECSEASEWASLVINLPL